MEFETFGLNVAKIRQQKGISAYELSLRLAKDPSYISKLESGKINITLKVILQLAEILGVSATEFFKKNKEQV